MTRITDRKITLGVRGQFSVRVHIDLKVCYFVVDFPYPGYAEVSKGWGVHPLKRNISWV